MQSDWAIDQAYPADPGQKFIVIDAGKSERLPFRLSLSEGATEIVDVLKIFATVDSPNFRWLELPALDCLIEVTATRSGDPLDALFGAIGGDAPPTRALNAATYPSREWVVQQIRITVKQ